MVAWVGSYFYSFQHNRGKLRQLASWLKEALPILGSKPSSRWHGADRLDVLVNEGRGNIREAAIVLGMQSRQLIKGTISLVRHGRDSMTVLISLTRPPFDGNEFEIFEASGPIPRSVLAAVDTPQAWQTEDFPRANSHKIAFRTDNGKEIAKRTLTLLLDDNFEIRRFSVRPNAPHFMLVFNLRKVPTTEAASLLRLIRTLSDEVTRPPKNSARRADKPSKNSQRKAQAFVEPEPALPGETRPGPDGYLRTTNHSKNGHVSPEVEE
ncbi:MAG: hypothetical protein JWP00_4050 [Chloroflexi bacterium]|nr:hypothetical protein [Chloroflexota bacterium]